jgi:TolB-like protein
MADVKPFLIPVIIDGTSNREAIVPDLFRSVQWTRLPAGETSPAFVERIQHLIAGDVRKASRSQEGPRTASIEGRQSTSWGLKGVLASAVAAALLAAFAYVGINRFRSAQPTEAPISALSSGSVLPSTSASVAVLPLANESGNSQQQYFSDGLSEDLITRLSQFPGLKVIGRTSSFQFRDGKDDSRNIGAKLGVAHLVEGSVRREGDVVRVSAELVNTTDDSTQWSARYDRPYKDLFALQDDITHELAAALKARLLPGSHEAPQSDRPPGNSIEAYNALLQGDFHGARYGGRLPRRRQVLHAGDTDRFQLCTCLGEVIAVLHGSCHRISRSCGCESRL